MADTEVTTAPMEPQAEAPPVEQQPLPGTEVLNGTEPAPVAVTVPQEQMKEEMPTQPEAVVTTQPVVTAEPMIDQTVVATEQPVGVQPVAAVEQPVVMEHQVVATEQVAPQPVATAETVVAMNTTETAAADVAVAKDDTHDQQSAADVVAAAEAAAAAEIDAVAGATIAVVDAATAVAAAPATPTTEQQAPTPMDTTPAVTPAVTDSDVAAVTEQVPVPTDAAPVPPVTPQEENEELRRMITELKDQLAKKDEEIEKLKLTGPKRKKPRVGPKLNPDGTPMEPGTPSKKMEVQKQKRDEVWKSRYNELVAYKLQNGDTNVPTKNYKPNPQLAHWVHTQRTRRRAWDAGKAGAGDLTQERIDALDSIGFQWNPGRRVNDDLWEQRFNELCEFKRENGHTNVPEKYAPNKSLGKWVSNQRHRRKLLDAGKKAKGMTRVRVEKLDAVGFEWTKN
mmetsp:Transcript_11370/g.17591  ORF Transcript_11370/g.17591 Transcript_11370/m.17591 type:complete len:451 (-) Transcript_11370:1235-2587(-)|eukprot:CAMPEP_0195287994 /NCGR_PEP_ID=MMETSP0707-20130614/4829_1 /TAXON_ID=33640 /ORGANISM="Asterionellopsis glacialis, Strain CCMP134" /LENGTH=450 /DNA_ID=CAMNT_0040347807 /DNA_START=98 /DNA_END=1450 /DNA_ORIENTATION=-